MLKGNVRMTAFENSAPFFTQVIEPLRTASLDAHKDGLAYRVYDPDRMVAGKRMEDHLRIAVCYWHSFCWPGSDVFGVGTFDRPVSYTHLTLPTKRIV